MQTKEKWLLIEYELIIFCENLIYTHEVIIIELECCKIENWSECTLLRHVLQEWKVQKLWYLETYTT